MQRPARPARLMQCLTPWTRRLTTLCALLLIAGCTGSPKKSKQDAPPNPLADTAGERPFWQDAPANSKTGPPTANVPSSVGNNSPSASRDGESGAVLAGRVVDNGNRSLGKAFIQVQAVDGRGASPIEVESTPQGHFYIRGLTQGRTYRLVARTKADGRTLAGEVVARPPDARLLIALSEDLSTSSTPPIPQRGSSAQTPTAELGAPRSANEYFPPPESIAGINPASAPRANIPAPGLPNYGAAPIADRNRSFGPVPDCLVSGGKVLTLRLSDPEGRTWDFAQHQNRLVLVDLWGTWCTPCLKAIPELIRVQQVYRTRGLEVIGIACEQGTSSDNIARVQSLRRRMPNINYRIFMAGEQDRDPIRAQLKPAGFPTLILLDSDGTILWKGVGADAIQEVEPIIRSRLGN